MSASVSRQVDGVFSMALIMNRLNPPALHTWIEPHLVTWLPHSLPLSTLLFSIFLYLFPLYFFSFSIPSFPFPGIHHTFPPFSSISFFINTSLPYFLSFSFSFSLFFLNPFPSFHPIPSLTPSFPSYLLYSLPNLTRPLYLPPSLPP